MAHIVMALNSYGLCSYDRRYLWNGHFEATPISGNEASRKACPTNFTCHTETNGHIYEISCGAYIVMAYIGMEVWSIWSWHSSLPLPIPKTVSYL